MKYLYFISGILLIVMAFLGWIFYGHKNGDVVGVYVIVGIVGAIISIATMQNYEEEKSLKSKE